VSLLIFLNPVFVVSFCGIVVPYASLPYFWRSWMYDLTPFRYLLEGLLGAVVHNVPVVCDAAEFARFQPPPGQTCQQYTSAYIAQAGGYVQNGTNGLCEFCQYANGDEFVSFTPAMLSLQSH
jgi:ATP-binding cassette subfamily G (WHITE) protein 2 (SNQ2)